ncbi:MAG: ATP-NAD kinase family protein [Thermoplasmata archaeon]
MIRIGFLVNPIAGMGGAVGLKGTDNVVQEAILKGAKPVAPNRARKFFEVLSDQFPHIIGKVSGNTEMLTRWYTVGDPMGYSICRSAGLDPEVAYIPEKPETTAKDTISAVRAFLEKKCDIIIFCGGDGTARDICSAVGTSVPVLGIPSGVKMHSGVFATTPESCAHVLAGFVNRDLRTGETEILDVDEEAYREGVWKVKLFGFCLTPVEPEFVQGSKCVIEVDESEILEGIADHLIEEMENARSTLFVFGPGSTTAHVFQKLRIEKTILGIDCVLNKKLIARDVSEKDLLELTARYRDVVLVLSPIGGQGFVLGRGNQQISPAVISKIPIDNIRIIATPAKLASIPALRFDIPDKKIIDKFKERKYLPVITGYHICTLKTVQV